MKKLTLKTTKEELSETLYGEKDMLSGFTKKEICQDVQTKIDMLRHIYYCIDEDTCNEIHTCDLYALGDIINLLNALKIEIK